MATMYSELKSFYNRNGIVVRLLLINIFVFILFNFIYLIDKLSLTRISIDILLNVSASSDFYTLITHPWTILTYMFFHESFLHIFFNMLMFYFAGQFFTNLLGSRKLLTTYILGGLAGLFLFVVSYNVFPALKPGLGGIIYGASAAVMAIFVALGAYAPTAPVRVFFFGPFKLIYVVLIFVLLDFFRLSNSLDLTNPSIGNAGGWIAHIGGAIYGAWFGFSYRQGKDISRWYERMVDGFKNLFKRKSKMKVHSHSKRPVSDEVYNDIKAAKQKKIDVILDKISRSGYESLSKEEKDFLFNASKDL